MWLIQKGIWLFPLSRISWESLTPFCFARHDHGPVPVLSSCSFSSSVQLEYRVRLMLISSCHIASTTLSAQQSEMAFIKHRPDNVPSFLSPSSGFPLLLLKSAESPTWLTRATCGLDAAYFSIPILSFISDPSQPPPDTLDALLPACTKLSRPQGLCMFYSLCWDNLHWTHSHLSLDSCSQILLCIRII